MIAFLVIAVAIVAFLLGVWLAPVINKDYGEFKAYVESKLKLAEHKARDKAIATINKL